MSFLDELIGVEEVTAETIRTFTKAPGSSLFTRLFGQTRRAAVNGIAQWRETRYPRGRTGVVADDQPARRIKKNVRRMHMTPLIHLRISKAFTPYELEETFGTSQPSEEQLTQFLADEYGGMVKILDTTKEYVCSAAMLNGVIDTGDLPNSEMDVEYTFDELLALDAAEDWNDPAADIVGKGLEEISDKAVKEGDFEPGLFVISTQIEKNLKKNDKVQAWAKQQAGVSILQSNVASEEVLGGLDIGGVSWTKSYGAYKDDGAAATKFMGDDQVIVLPKQDELAEVLAMFEAPGYIPLDVHAEGTPQGTAGKWRASANRELYAYSIVGGDPVSMKVVMGTRFMPAFMNQLKRIKVATGA